MNEQLSDEKIVQEDKNETLEPHPKWDTLMKYSRIIRHQYPNLSEQLDSLDDLFGKEAADYALRQGAWNQQTESYDKYYDKHSYMLYLLDQGHKQGLLSDIEHSKLMQMLAKEELA